MYSVLQWLKSTWVGGRIQQQQSQGQAGMVLTGGMVMEPGAESREGCSYANRRFTLHIGFFKTGLLFGRTCAGKPCLLWIHGCDSHVTSTGCHFVSSSSSMTLILSFSVLTWFSSTRKLHPCYCPWHWYLNKQTLCMFSWGKHIFWVRVYSSQTHTYVKDKKLQRGSFRCSTQNQPLHDEYEEWLTVK